MVALGKRARARHQEGGGAGSPRVFREEANAMNKLFAVVVSSVAGLGLAAGQAAAWFHDCCCNKCCCTTICLRQYNAFTPICCGQISCDGCCPLTFGGFCNNQPPAQPHGCATCGGYGYGGAHPDFGHGSYGPGAPATGHDGNGPPTPPPANLQPAPPATMPGVNPPGYRAPMPSPLENAAPLGTGPTTQRWTNPTGQVQYAGYQPAYYPAGYAPMAPAYYGMPMGGLMPYYWNGR
jgi:hypothetical protein